MTRRRQRFWVIIGLITLFILAQFAFFAPARDLARRIVAKPVMVVAGIGQKVSDTFALIGSIRQLAKENAQLREQTVTQLAEIADLTNVKNENQQLREDLNFSDLHPELSLLPASIINYSPIGSYQALTINKGNRDGIKENQAVVSSGFLIGKIKNVTDSTAEVWLLTNRNLATPVILTGSQVTGILKGGIRGLVVDNIPVDTTITPGELVVSSSLEGLYPAGLAIGQVEETISQKEEIFIALRISSPVNVANIRTVFVVQ